MLVKNFPGGHVGTNCYLAVDEESKKAFIVDPATPNQRLARFIEDQGLTVEYLILTHGHGDHIGGVPYFQEAFPSAKLVAGEEEKPLLENAQWNFSAEICGQALEPKADIYVKEGDSLQVGNLSLEFIHTPGHTPGGMSILADGVLFSGDTLFARSVGRTDFPLSSWDQLVSSIREKLFTLPDATPVYPGHMGATTIGEEKRSNPFV